MRVRRLASKFQLSVTPYARSLEPKHNPEFSCAKIAGLLCRVRFAVLMLAILNSELPSSEFPTCYMSFAAKEETNLRL